MERPPSGLRTDLTVTAGSVFRSGEEESRRVPVGGTAENAGVTWERVAAPRLLDMVDLVGKIPEG
jgi:hypothetical protein